jgi:cysteinyl-tRNA synthetase
VINQAKDAGIAVGDIKSAQNLLVELGAVLGLRLQRTTTSTGGADPFVDLLVEMRTELRNQKLWALSDLIRDRLIDLGVSLEDGKEGTVWRWH